jgi:hypothetical protein
MIMAQHTDTRTVRRTIGLIGAVTCLAAVGMMSLSAPALARAGGGGGHAGGHVEAGRGGFGHGGFARGGAWHGGFARGGFFRGGHYYHYGLNGILIEDCCYAAPIYVAPPLPVVVAPPAPVVVAPYGVVVR